jgi:endonuclease YncB( thermonuclease family)
MMPRQIAAVLAAAMMALAAAPVPGARAGGAGPALALCGGGVSVNCIVDGDTFDVGGVRIRMVDYDAPEIGKSRCAREHALGEKARLRLRDLLNSGAILILPSGSRDEDRYGRKLRMVTLDGQSVGKILIAEGLAWPWEGRRHDWCHP